MQESRQEKQKKHFIQWKTRFKGCLSSVSCHSAVRNDHKVQHNITTRYLNLNLIHFQTKLQHKKNGESVICFQSAFSRIQNFPTESALSCNDLDLSFVSPKPHRIHVYPPGVRSPPGCFRCQSKSENHYKDPRRRRRSAGKYFKWKQTAKCRQSEKTRNKINNVTFSLWWAAGIINHKMVFQALKSTSLCLVFRNDSLCVQNFLSTC